MADDDFARYIQAQVKAVEVFQRSECLKQGSHVDRNDAARRWVASGRASAFRRSWYDEDKCTRDKDGERRHDEEPGA